MNNADLMPVQGNERKQSSIRDLDKDQVQGRNDRGALKQVLPLKHLVIDCMGKFWIYDQSCKNCTYEAHYRSAHEQGVIPAPLENIRADDRSDGHAQRS